MRENPAQSTKTRTYRSHLFTAVVLLTALLLSMFRLNDSFLNNWDEAFYADGMRHMLSTQEFVVAYWNNSPFLDKPPLHIWIGILGRSWIGESSAGYRFTSASATFICLAVVFFFAREKFGSVPALIAFLSLASNPIFIWRGRGANTDALLTLLIFCLFVLSQKKFRGKYIVIGLLLSLVYMTKSTVVLFPLLAIGCMELLEFWEERKKIRLFYKTSQWITCAFFALFIPAIWLFAGYQKIGWYFVKFYVWLSDSGASELHFQHFQTHYLYAALSMGVMILFVLVGLFCALFSFRSKFSRALLFFGLPLPIALSFSSVNYHWYLMPAIPIWSLAAGYAFWLLQKKIPSKVFISILFCALLLAIGWQFYRKVSPIYSSNSAYHQAMSGLWLKSNTPEDEVIVRLDHQYPTLIFYAQRKVFVSTLSTPNEMYFLSPSQISTQIGSGRLKWFSGTDSDIQTLATTLKPGTFIIYAVTEEESVLKITHAVSEPQ